MTKEHLIDALSKTLTPIIEEFAAQPSPAAQLADEKREKLESQRANLGKALEEGSPAYNAAVSAIDEELKGLKIDDRTQRKQNLQLAAEAMVVVTNTLRVPLKLKDVNPPASSSAKASAAGSTTPTGKRARKSTAQMEEETRAVYKALPGASRDFVSKGFVADKVGFDPSSALLKLKRDGEAESNGVRGAGGGWRKAE